MPVWKNAPSNQFYDTGSGLAVLVAFALGGTFGFGLLLAFTSDEWWDVGLYMVAHSGFHLWEYVYVALYHPHELNVHSFLLPPSHSNEFAIAFCLAIVEYTIERSLFGLYGNGIVVVVGFLVVLVGQVARTLAMWTAASNFHHLVRDEKEEKHKLVTHGIYQYLRHPSYFGFFWWSVGMQVVLMNPIMAGLNAYAAFTFFKDRIKEEEKHLVEFFGKDYEQFRKNTQVGIPGIQ